jgi:hypothetical protein
LKLIPRFLGRTPLADGFEAVELAERIRGMAPADLEAVTTTAKRMALNRAGLEAKQVPPLIWSDFEEAIKRNRAVVWRSPDDVEPEFMLPQAGISSLYRLHLSADGSVRGKRPALGRIFRGMALLTLVGVVVLEIVRRFSGARR